MTYVVCLVFPKQNDATYVHHELLDTKQIKLGIRIRIDDKNP